MLGRAAGPSAVHCDVVLMLSVTACHRGVEETARSASLTGAVDAALKAADGGARRQVNCVVRRFALVSTAVAAA